MFDVVYCSVFVVSGFDDCVYCVVVLVELVFD